MADLTDVLTTLKNGVVAANNLSQSIAKLDQHYFGTSVTAVITGQTLVLAGSGYVSAISVTVAGAAGTINDAKTTAGAASANVLCVIPATAGVLRIGIPFVNGLVISPGAGQSVVVSYTTS